MANVMRQHRLWIIIYLILLIIIIALVIAVIIINVRQQPHLCLSFSCIQSASRILHFLDSTVNPCDDFYSFACGGYIKNYKPSESTLKTMSDVVNNQLILLLEGKLPTDAPKIFNYLKKVYNLCVNGSQINKTNEYNNVKKILKYLGEWPALVGKQWNENNFNWTMLLIKLRKRGLPYNFFFQVFVDIDLFNSSNYTLVVNIEDSIAFKQFRKPTPNHKNLIPLMFGANRTLIKEDMSLVKQFEEKLLNIINEPLLSNSFYITIEELQKLFPDVDWMWYIKSLIDLPNFIISKKREILVRNVKKLKLLQNLLQETSKRFDPFLLKFFYYKLTSRIQANYIIGIVMEFVFTHLHAYRLKYTSISPTSHECASIISESLSLPMGMWYSEVFLDASTQQEVETIVANIVRVFKKKLYTTEWLEDSTRSFAIKKLNEMKKFIGFPKNIKRNTVEEYFKEIVVDFSNYLNASLCIYKFNEDQIFKRLDRSVRDYITIEHAQRAIIVNAEYNVIYNSILIPSAFLLNTVFDKNRPASLNYAIAGSIIGHEITHGFDNKGRKYDENGFLKNWWSTNSSLAFERKTECIIFQYKNYKFFNNSVNGVRTLGENIADNGGAKYAYAAYINLNLPQQLLPGVTFTNNQIFWLSFSQIWCSNPSENDILAYTKDVHAPPKFRVIGTLKNMENFARDFNCPLRSPMNPIVKCVIW